ncbi:YjbH domain-containing protein [bacterium]|nr:YjbH domain-containing protein [bacterium]
MRRVFACVVVLLLLSAACFAQQQTYQITTTSWHGLSGLYVVPTARSLGRGQLAMGYNESRHAEFIGNGRFLDRQIRATMTYGLSDRVEISGSYIRDMLTAGDNFTPTLSNESFSNFSAKWRICDETKSRPAVALAVRDIFNDMQDVGPFTDVNNGTKYFLLATKRLVYKQDTGRFVDGTLGITKDDQRLAALFGMEMALSPSISFVAEGMWDSPYLNFRDMYYHADKKGTSDHPGRFIFDTGFRIYPDVLPGFVIDLGVMADSQPEYCWGFSYVAGL